MCFDVELPAFRRQRYGRKYGFRMKMSQPSTYNCGHPLVRFKRHGSANPWK